MRSTIDHLMAVALLSALGLATLARGPATLHASQSHSPDAGTPAKTMAAPAGQRQHASTLVVGVATYYADDFHGRMMANGRLFDMHDPTLAAANRWPLGTVLQVRRLPGSPWEATLDEMERDLYFSRTITVVVSDRGAFTHELDLSLAAFSQIGRADEGRILVSIEELSLIQAPPPR